ncbi:hypothetical protein BT63DRAFT_451870 [Microthyrium microscopicum]|uniref:Uncharacterized protein n=1 Tax=Microthyrium microscopicum TaxID=703497 RepID=A0A6A6UNF7_9PEZI|nr:hypothetical protein BT63DRAFT_451870 [Microthyrium microscopicum]
MSGLQVLPFRWNTPNEHLKTLNRGNLFIRLPAEIWELVADHLDETDKASLTISTAATLRAFRYTPIHAVRWIDGPLVVLEGFRRLYRRGWFCDHPFCRVYHTGTIPRVQRSTGWLISAVFSHWPRPCTCHGHARTIEMPDGPWGCDVAQMIMKRIEFGPAYGNILGVNVENEAVVKYNETHLRSPKSIGAVQYNLAREGECQPAHYSREARIVDGKLLVKSQLFLVIPYWLRRVDTRTLENEWDERYPVTGRYSILIKNRCLHWDDPTQAERKALLCHLITGWKLSGSIQDVWQSRGCPYCPTEMSEAIVHSSELDRSKWNLAFTNYVRSTAGYVMVSTCYRDFGNGMPTSKEWKALTTNATTWDDGFDEGYTGEAQVGARFEGGRRL